ncbi:MAG: CocE/NonD family hydrolase [Lachnospiraceae bacterium]|nr:CocE/NonD family hydrolase [Lachnospiraceae bacterium]
MERWGFYLSGIKFGILEIQENVITHQMLNVMTDAYDPSEELRAEDNRYQVMGKMNVFEALTRLPEYENGIAQGSDRFETCHGEIFTKRCNGEYVQRIVKFPKDLMAENGKIFAVLTTYRDQCAVLVKEGYENRTILSVWNEKYKDPLYAMKPMETYMVPMRDGVRLATDVYLPNCDHKVPTVLIRTPYGKHVGASMYFKFVQRGYAVVIQDVRGRDDSEGAWLPNTCETEDGDDTLNWIAAQEWSDGGVGMTGGSYLGYVQWAAAASGNPHLKAMLSSVTAGSAFVDLPRRGGCYCSGMMAWAFMVSGQRSEAELMDRDDWDEVLDIRPLQDMAPKAINREIPFINTYLDHMDYDDFWYQGDWKARMGENRVPALIMSGWFDDNGMGTTEALDVCEDYEEKKVILGPWIHSGNAHYDVHGLELGMNALRYDMDLICLDWLEHYLKGVDNGIEKTPKVEYYTMGSNEWKTASNWPVPETKELVLYLDGKADNDAVKNEGILSVSAPKCEQADTFLYDPENPSTHIIDMSENEIEVPEDYTEEEKRDDMLCYTTEVLKEDLTITGDAWAEIYLSSDCEDTDLVVRITDVEENGRSMKLADGLICVRYRNGFDKPEFMEEGKVYPVKIRTTKLSHTFKAGHKLRVTVTSSAKNFIFPNSNTRDGFNSVTVKKANNSVHRGGAYASKVTLRME